MRKEAPQELGGGKSHHLLLAAMRIILPSKAYVFSIESEQSMIRDRNAMRIAFQITKDLQWAAEWGVGGDGPAP
jgi:hypothetical protein